MMTEGTFTEYNPVQRFDERHLQEATRQLDIAKQRGEVDVIVIGKTYWDKIVTEIKERYKPQLKNMPPRTMAHGHPQCYLGINVETVPDSMVGDAVRNFLNMGWGVLWLDEQDGELRWIQISRMSMSMDIPDKFMEPQSTERTQ